MQIIHAALTVHLDLPTQVVYALDAQQASLPTPRTVSTVKHANKGSTRTSEANPTAGLALAECSNQLRASPFAAYVLLGGLAQPPASSVLLAPKGGTKPLQPGQHWETSAQIAWQASTHTPKARHLAAIVPADNTAQLV
jgi:hypothetical protein